jgi:hypothetical protein
MPMTTKMKKICVIALLAGSLALVASLNYALACGCGDNGCKWINGDSSYATGGCDITQQPNLKCKQGHYECGDKTGYEDCSLTYHDGAKIYKEYDCTDAINGGKDCGSPPDGINDCDPIPSGCSYTQDSGDDLADECSNSAC